MRIAVLLHMCLAGCLTCVTPVTLDRTSHTVVDTLRSTAAAADADAAACLPAIAL
jgi:hypothetical protein